MSNGSGNGQQNSGDVVARAQAAGKAVYDAVQQTVADPIKASNAASDAISHAISHSTAVKGVIDAFLVLLNPILTAFFTTLTEVRHGASDTMGAATAEILNDYLGTDFDSSVVTPPGGGDATLAKAAAIGKAVLARLEQEFAQGQGGGGEPGGQAAATFAGFGLNIALQNSIIGIIGACVPELHLEELRDLGEEVMNNLGLARLMRTALHPLIQTLIALPYQQELYTKYSPVLLGQGELVKAWLASRLVQADVMDSLRKHGLPDSQITEAIEQARKRLNAKEWNVLTAIGQQGDDPTAYDDNAEGMDDDWIRLRQIVLTGDRLAPAVTRVLSEVLAQIKGGWLDSTSLEKYLSKYNLPQDEVAFWRDAAGELQDVPRKRISESQMLFLYEAAQVTDADVQQWAEAEGYSSQDVQRVLTYFRLELIAKSSGVSPAKAAHLAALHTEHTAYVTDEITGLWGRAPTKDELNYWVALLDSGARTKHDFVTELKELPTTGPAMP
jgi:hypothetical protein